LNELVAGFPDDKAITFVGTHSMTLCAINQTETETSPDIGCTRGQPATPQSRSIRDYVIFVEVKSLESDDPFHPDAAGRNRTLYRLCTYVRNLMFANFYLFAFIVGIYGHKARIYRFDHAGAVASPNFDYVSHPELLGEFFLAIR
jgi:hypothetical protein